MSQPSEADNQWAVLAGLRFFLAMIVATHHFSSCYDADAPLPLFAQLSSRGAVMAFLVLSGYSMAHSLGRDADPWRFYRRRFWRIYPTYMVSLVLGFLPELAFGFFPVVHSSVCYLRPVEGLWAAPFFLQGFAVRMYTGNGVVWSLSLEVFFYLISPLLRRVSAQGMLLMFGASLGACMMYIQHHRFNPFGNGLYGRDAFLLGWLYLAGFAFYRFRDRFSHPDLLLAGAFGLGHYFAYPDFDRFMWVTLGGTALLLYHARHIPLARRLRAPLIWLGDLSLPLYLVHLPITMTLGMIGVGPWGRIAAIGGGTLMTYYFVDRPTRVFRVRATVAPSGAPEPHPGSWRRMRAKGSA